MPSRILRRPALLRAVSVAPLALAVCAAPVAAGPAQFPDEATWTLACGDAGTIEVRSQLSNGVVWLTSDGRTLLTIAGERKVDGVWTYYWGPRNVARTGFADRVFTCTTTVEREDGSSVDLRLQTRYVP